MFEVYCGFYFVASSDASYVVAPLVTDDATVGFHILSLLEGQRKAFRGQVTSI